MRVCAVQSCHSSEESSSSYQLYQLPQNVVTRIRWLSALGHDDIKPGEDFAVCSRHFLPSDFADKGVLTEDAVPSLHLAQSCLKAALQSPGRRKRSRELARLDIGGSTLCQPSVGRPSRRAARVAAAKISDTVKKYNLASTPPHTHDSDEDFDLAAEERRRTFTRSPPLTPTIVMMPSAPRTTVQMAGVHKPAPWPPLQCSVTPSLWLECQEDTLSHVQMMAHARAHRTYERSARRIQEARASGAKVMLCRPRLNIPGELLSSTGTTVVMSRENVQVGVPLLGMEPNILLQLSS